MNATTETKPSELASDSASSRAAQCSASRLYRVTVEFELVVEAKSEREAESLAEYHANQDGSEPGLVVATVLKRIEDAPEEWRDSIPFGGDRNDERTVRERVTQNAPDQRPAKQSYGHD